MNCLVLRLSNSYGEPALKNKDCWNLLLNNLVKTAFEEKKIVIKSNGLSKHNFIHYSDICSNIEAVINKDIEIHKINLESNKVTNIRYVAYKIRKVYKDRYNLLIPIFINKNHRLNISKKSLDEIDSIISNKYSAIIEPNMALEEGINLMFDYLEKEQTYNLN